MNHRLSHWIDRLLALALAGATLMTMASALGLVSPAARAAERLSGNGNLASQTRPLAEFDALQVSGDIDVHVRQGSPATATVSVDSNLLPYLETVVEDSGHGKALVLRWKHGLSIHTRQHAKVELVAPHLSQLASAGSADITLESFKAGQLSASVSGSGDLRFNGLTAETLSVAVAGSGDVRASGQVQTLALRIAGSGDAQTEALKADDVRVSIAGSGDAAVQANRTLEVSIAGSGDVLYSGNAQVKSSVAGSGSVRKR